MGTQTEQVFAELLEELSSQHRRLVAQLSGVGDEQSLLEAHKWLLSILQVATETQVWADPEHPRFVEIVGPYKKWGGDNADAFYYFAPVDPARTYRVRVRRGDAVYLSLTVYGGPDDGRYSERIVGSLNDRQAPPGEDGVITMVLSPDDPGDGTPWIRLERDAVRRRRAEAHLRDDLCLECGRVRRLRAEWRPRDRWRNGCRPGVLRGPNPHRMHQHRLYCHHAPLLPGPGDGLSLKARGKARGNARRTCF